MLNYSSLHFVVTPVFAAVVVNHIQPMKRMVSPRLNWRGKGSLTRCCCQTLTIWPDETVINSPRLALQEELLAERAAGLERIDVVQKHAQFNIGPRLAVGAGPLELDQAAAN